MKVMYIPLTSATRPVNVRYHIDSKVKDAGTVEYSYSSALVYGPQDPVDSYTEPGDVWINTGPEKRVWIVSAERECVQWPGNDAEFRHPWFTNLFFYYSGVACWNWWRKDTNLRHTRTRQRRASADFGKWMEARGKVNGDLVSLGSDSDAMEHWLKKHEKEKEKEATKGTKQKWHEKRPKVSNKVGVTPESPQDCEESSTAGDGGSDLLSSKRACLHVPLSTDHAQPSSPMGYLDPAVDCLLGRPKQTVTQSNAAGAIISDAPPSSGPRDHGEYQPPLLDCCLGEREGREWPLGSPTLTWPNGIETVLPYVKSEHTAMS
ncbi:hypothetical protein EWM64_g4468 [Hericium alpestre]|uniref:Uncharacterized protein n=1 Tax=Hericium alpestre TaxID=135208 RepID=A0A4Y9ZYD3_9AGAM|nr:hypothetical protein EWM64_g4468 [Hericium alpestre]